MRFLVATIVFILLINTSKAQSSFQGEYRMNQMINESVPDNVTLKLNCNGTYIRISSSQVAYGKWKMKKGDLVLLADSATSNNKTDIVFYKLVYENIENRFHIKSVPRKEYDDMVTLVRTIFPTAKGTKSGYQKCKKDEKALYYEKVTGYDCKLFHPV